MAPEYQEARAAFIRTFQDTARHQHRYEVWRDFVIMAACALHNGLYKEETREAEYLEIIYRYEKADQERFPLLLAHLIELLQEAPKDTLGPLYMELEIGSKDRGQFFTPPELSEAMARMTFGAELSALEGKPFITVQEPACGAGGMVLALVKVLIEAGHNPADKLFVHCIDVDRVAALMCFIQLTLWHVPAEVVVGNTLTLETREVWYTPAYHLGFWHNRLRSERLEEAAKPPTPPADVEPVEADEPRPEPNYEEHQIDWRGQPLTIRYCASWLGQDTAHLEIISPDRKPHPISETGYRSHFLNALVFEEAGGPVAYTLSWLAAVDDDQPTQLSLF